MNEPKWNEKRCVTDPSHPQITEYYNPRVIYDNVCAWRCMWTHLNQLIKGYWTTRNFQACVLGQAGAKLFTFERVVEEYLSFHTTKS